MPDAGKVTKAELAEAVRELREEVAALRAERAAHTCHGHTSCCSHAHCNWGHCYCWTVHNGYSYPLTWTVSATSVGGSISGYTSTLGN